MMKKILCVIILLCSIIGTVFYLYNTPKYEPREYLVVNNENDEYKYIFDNDTYSIFSNYDATTAPFDSLLELTQLDIVKNVYPYYNLKILGDNGSIIFNDNEIKFPLEGKYDSGESFYINDLNIKQVTNSDNFEYTHRKYGEDLLIKEYDTNSGIYITEFLYQYLGLDGTEKSLKITVPISVPVVCEFKTENFDGLFDYEMYYCTTYEVVYVDLDVQGVIKFKDVQIKYCNVMDIVMPYDFVCTIFNSVDQTKYDLQPGQSYYKPNTCIVELTGTNLEEEFGNQAYDKGYSIVYSLNDYGANIDEFEYWYDGAELRTWPNPF